ncbi:alpha/beta hydrolase [Sphingomonas prati]|uniref:Lysophospholipase n=1 Tax=Sphingomonas prati TaxID=1843237 RepID=A0A7W9F394_9SPHN|nr:alpha/beta hydrolase [Sphingomonas prati]MBB5729275.1 lysophospholipase [Sphingomonas prati]GGE78696.1 lysophospholipase [Sphingomonas prati]
MPTPPFDRRTIPPGLSFAPWTAPDGWVLRRLHWPAPANRACRGRMLFQTGRGDFAEKYLETMAHWHARGWDISGFDWRGQGGSQRADGEEAGLGAMLDDLRAFAAEWRRADGMRHVAVGHSMGGHLLLRLLAEGFEVDRAVLVAPMLGLKAGGLPASVAGAIARTAVTLGLGDRLIAARSAGTIGRQGRLTGDGERYADEAHWVGLYPAYRVLPPRWRWLAEAYASIARLEAAGVLEAVWVPTLLIGAERDQLVDARAIRAAAARMPAASLMMRGDAAHELLREVDAVRDAVLARIDAHLDDPT